MNRRNALLGLAAAAPFAATTVSLAQTSSGGPTIPTNLVAILTSGGTTVGTLAIQRFANVNGVLQAIGTLTATNGVTTAVTTLAVPVTLSTLPISTVDPPATCPILHLDIGPIDLTLLGLQITTNEIVINIVAHSGPGNLLGTLLCAVANLLNQPGGLSAILNQLVATLNQLLGQL